jgi:NAD(P)-dependent dehydrogenase (short-subunit alcohol dehydrogenase family)
MMLKDKGAVIYGAGGAIGSAVARAFAREGAKLCLCGRSLQRVNAVAREIGPSAALVEAAEVDALDERAVDQYLDQVIEKAGAVDISFSAVGIANTTLQGKPLAEVSLEDFLRPISLPTHSDLGPAQASR